MIKFGGSAVLNAMERCLLWVTGEKWQVVLEERARGGIEDGYFKGLVLSLHFVKTGWRGLERLDKESINTFLEDSGIFYMRPGVRNG